MPKPLPLSFFKRPSDIVAPELIGCRLVVRSRRSPTSSSPLVPPLTAYITEVEAYLGTTDPASHAWKGRRVRSNESIYAPPGTWYVYLSYGVNWCSDLTAQGKDPAHALLLRGCIAADEETRRIFRRRRGPNVADRNLSDGPGKMTQALGIDVSLDGMKMAGSWAEVFPAPRNLDLGPVVVTPRVGISRAMDWPLRWVVK